ncbi:hypothetical protein EI555_012193, partial [Monodon monoceros]
GPATTASSCSRKTCAGTGHKESLCGAGGTKAALCGKDPPPLLRQAPGTAGTGDTLAECPGHGQGSRTVFGLRSSRRAPPSPPLIASQPPAVPHPPAQLNGTPAMGTKTCGGPADRVSSVDPDRLWRPRPALLRTHLRFAGSSRGPAPASSAS